MGKCIKMECYYCKSVRYFYVNVNNYKCTQCGRTVPHAPIDERETTGYDYKQRRRNIIFEDADEFIKRK